MSFYKVKERLIVGWFKVLLVQIVRVCIKDRETHFLSPASQEPSFINNKVPYKQRFASTDLREFSNQGS